MFSIIFPQGKDQPVLSQIQSKRQSFHNEIRRKKVNDYKAKIRAKLIYDSQLNYDMLHNINLKQVMITIAHYEFPSQVQNSRQFRIDDCHKVYDLERPCNQVLKRAFEELFLYVTSSMSDHALPLLDDAHIMRVAELLDKKIQQMKPYFKQKSYKELKKADTLILPLIYEKLLVILTQWSYDENVFFQEAYRFLIHVLNELMKIFPLQTRVIQCSTYCLVNSFHKPSVMEDLMYRLNNQNKSNCIFSKVLEVPILISKIFEFQVKNFDKKSYHSNTVIKSILNFYGKLFNHIKIVEIYPQMRRKIFKCFHQMLTHSQCNEEINLEILRSLIQLYHKDVGVLSHIVLETKDILMEIIDLLHSGLVAFSKKKVKQNDAMKSQILQFCFEILKSVFGDAGQDNESLQQICEFLQGEVEDKIDLIIQYGLKAEQKLFVHNSLQLIKLVCLWGDFVTHVYQNNNIMIKLFYYSQQQKITFKKQAILALCNILEGLYADKNQYDVESCEIYENIVERFDFLEILVDNLDRHHDVNLNTEILNIIKILCLFWQTDPELQRQNRFWIKFVQNGGQLKLNTIVTENRNEEMQEIANQILDLFVGKQIQI